MRQAGGREGGGVIGAVTGDGGFQALHHFSVTTIKYNAFLESGGGGILGQGGGVGDSGLLLTTWCRTFFFFFFVRNLKWETPWGVYKCTRPLLRYCR